MHRWIAVIAGLVILIVANASIHSREKLLTEGREVLLELAPVDPRSLMQGDYMALRFKVADEAFGRVPSVHSDGRIVLQVDERGVGNFVRFHEGSALAAEEVLMRYRVRNDKPKFGTNAYFFQEGQASRFVGARYGEFRVDAGGETILTGLRAKNLAPLR